MTRTEYEHLKAKAYQDYLSTCDALDRVFELCNGKPSSDAPAPRKPRKDVEAVLASMPEKFTRQQFVDALGATYGSAYYSLRSLLQKGKVVVVRQGGVGPGNTSVFGLSPDYAKQIKGSEDVAA